MSSGTSSRDSYDKGRYDGWKDGRSGKEPKSDSNTFDYNGGSVLKGNTDGYNSGYNEGKSERDSSNSSKKSHNE